MIGAASLTGSLGVLLINSLGGYLFDHVSRAWPFWMVVISYALCTIMVLLMVITGKLRV